jgi:hypothetical protein
MIFSVADQSELTYIGLFLTGSSIGQRVLSGEITQHCGRGHREASLIPCYRFVRQGNLLIRAYIERFNDPPVHNFISVHGPLAGVGGLPRCSPLNFICKEIDKVGGVWSVYHLSGWLINVVASMLQLIGEAVYTKRVQGVGGVRMLLSLRGLLTLVCLLQNVSHRPTTSETLYASKLT